MAQKLTKRQRMTEKIEGGLTHLEAEMAIVEEDTAAKLSSLKARQEKEEARIKDRMLVLLEKSDPEAYGRLRKDARKAITSDVKDRRARAQGTSTSGAPGQPGQMPAATHPGSQSVDG